jgi:hypothetical protein
MLMRSAAASALAHSRPGMRAMKSKNTVLKTAAAALRSNRREYREHVLQKAALFIFGEHPFLGLRARDRDAGSIQILAKTDDDGSTLRSSKTPRACARSIMSRPLSRCRSARSLVQRISSFEDTARLALNCAITACHLHEWVLGDWLKTDYAKWKELDTRDKSTFVTWLKRECPGFDTLQDSTNGAKHFIRQQESETQRVAGFGMGPYGVGPYGKSYLLIDYGEDADRQRWQTAEDLLGDAGSSRKSSKSAFSLA